MANFADITMTGGSQFANALKVLPLALNRKAKLEALLTAAEPIRRRMSQGAPKGDEPPHIADNIGVSEVKKIDGQTLGDLEVAVAIGPTKGFNYGLPWEYGWEHHPSAHPFARPAFDGEHETSLRILGVRLWEILKRPGGV